jgi:hypothetical protein
MTNYNFSLVLSGISAEDEDHADRLYPACDDGLVCGYGKTVYVDFSRESTSYETAVLSAITGIEKTCLGVHVISVDAGDYVGITDIGKHSKISKQSIALLKDGKRGAGDFPNPIQRLEGTHPLWRWSDVAQWLASNDKIDPILAINAQITADINLALALRKDGALARINALIKNIPRIR